MSAGKSIIQLTVLKDGTTARIIGYKNEILGANALLDVDARLTALTTAGITDPALINIVGKPPADISTALNEPIAKPELAKYPALPDFKLGGGKARRGRTRRGGNRKSSKTKRRRH